MNTPIFDFVKAYCESGIHRFHMPGHKGKAFLGCEAFDITEIKGADSLYEADGIIRQSEENAGALFGSGRTYFSAEGSSQCIKAMVYIAISMRPKNTPPIILAGRNAHKSFLYACALNDAEPIWIKSEGTDNLCRCIITPQQLEYELRRLEFPPAAVYITSPDYLGGTADISGLAEICHRYGTLLMVDNAHGAYLHFLEKPMHPLDLGADLCCDSAHKTLPVLTGGAYLHTGKSVFINENIVKHALSLFGSTSPSYLILASLDKCNEYLDAEFRAELKETLAEISIIKDIIKRNGWDVQDSDPLKLTIRAPEGLTGNDISEHLRNKGIECEYADKDYAVMMLTPQNSHKELCLIPDALGINSLTYSEPRQFDLASPERALSVREAVFSEQKTVNVDNSEGLICASPVVSCPPAIPIVASGEIISSSAIEIMKYYGISFISVVE